MLEKLDGINDNPHYFSLKVFKNLLGDDLRKRYGSRKVKSDIEEDEPQEFHRYREIGMECLTEEPAGATFIEEFESENFKEEFRRAAKSLKLFCQMMLAAILDDKQDEVYSIFTKLYPGHSKSDYYVQTMHCREKFNLIRSELAG